MKIYRNQLQFCIDGFNSKKFKVTSSKLYQGYRMCLGLLPGAKIYTNAENVFIEKEKAKILLIKIRMAIKKG